MRGNYILECWLTHRHNWQLAAIMASQCVLCVALAVRLQACQCIFAVETVEGTEEGQSRGQTRGSAGAVVALAAVGQKHFDRQKH